MLFNVYPNIEDINDQVRNRYYNCENSHKCDWYVSELIDGVPFIFYTDYKTKEVKVGNGKAFLKKDDNYYDWDEVLKLHREWLIDASTQYQQDLIVYGKLVGGKYKDQKLGVHIPSVCEYAVHNDFVVHDVQNTDGFASLMDLEIIADKNILTMAPVLFKGSFIKSWCFPENNLSALSFQYELPINFKNQMKGIVVRPLYHMLCQNKMIIAKKLNKMYTNVIGSHDTDDRKKEVPLTDLEIKQIASFIFNISTNMNLIDIVISVNGGFNHGEIDKLSGKHTQLLLDKVNYIKYNLCSSKQQNEINIELNALAREKLLAIWRVSPSKSA